MILLHIIILFRYLKNLTVSIKLREYINTLMYLYLQEGRTPLHYAAALQGTTGGLNQLYTVLVDNGADENVVDVVSLLQMYTK